MHAFQGEGKTDQQDGHLLAQSTIKSYLAMDKRDGLIAIAKRLVSDIHVGETRLRWQRGFSDTDKVTRSEGGGTLALSAFHLSSLPNAVARKDLVREMWSSGAELIVCPPFTDAVNDRL